MTNICVFCGARDNIDQEYIQSAISLGEAITNRGHTLVYGGSTSGLMGVIADTVISAGGSTIGIRPKQLDHLEETHSGLTQLIEVDTMAERKLSMMDSSHAFVALPGGYGTLDELFEVWVMRSIGQHSKPIGILNQGGYYDQLLGFLQTVENNHFASNGTLQGCAVASDAETLLSELLHATDN